MQQILIQQLINGINIGAVYALIALGYTLVYGIMRMINFAHGDLYMVGAFVGYLLLSLFAPLRDSFGLVLAFIGAMAVVGLLGVLIERVAYRRLRRAPRLMLFITAIAVSFILQNFVKVATGARFYVYPLTSNVSLRIADIPLTWAQVLNAMLSVLLMAALYLFTQKTDIGIAMRATANNQTAAQLVGIDTNKVVAYAFLLGGILAASAGVLSGVYYGQINFYMGFIMGIKAFTAAVIGGIGNIPGTMLGGFILGLLESVGVSLLGGEWKDIFAFSLLILMLALRPTGLLGERMGDRL